MGNHKVLFVDRSSETPVSFHRATRRYVPEDKSIHISRYGKGKFVPVLN
jgi:hypothetical protein